MTNDKVVELFRRFAGERAEALSPTHYPAGINSLITSALHNENNNLADCDAVGFHLVDWQNDAAFLVALHLFPDEFSPEEIRDRLLGFFLHVPAHLITAAKIYEKVTGSTVDYEPYDTNNE